MVRDVFDSAISLQLIGDILLLDLRCNWPLSVSTNDVESSDLVLQPKGINLEVLFDFRFHFTRSNGRSDDNVVVLLQVGILSQIENIRYAAQAFGNPNTCVAR